MATIVTRSGKGSALTHVEADANFTNLNTDKAELASPTFTGTVTIPTVDINGGTINGITDLAIVDGGTGSSTASGARTNLGLGALAVLNSVAAGQIDTDAVGASEIAAGAVGASEIATGAVGASEIATGVITATHLAANSVGSSEIVAGAVGTSEIATDAVGASELDTDDVFGSASENNNLLVSGSTTMSLTNGLYIFTAGTTSTSGVLDYQVFVNSTWNTVSSISYSGGSLIQVLLIGSTLSRMRNNTGSQIYVSYVKLN